MDSYVRGRGMAKLAPASKKDIADPNNLVTTYTELDSAHLTYGSKDNWDRFWLSRRYNEFSTAKKNLQQKGYYVSDDYMNREDLGNNSYRSLYKIVTNMAGPTYPTSKVIGERLRMEDVVRLEKELPSIREESFSHQEKLYREKRKAERANAQPAEVSAGSRKRRVT